MGQHNEKVKLFRKIYQLSSVGLSLREILIGVGETNIINKSKTDTILDALNAGSSFTESLKTVFDLTKHEEATLHATQITGNVSDALKSIISFYVESTIFKKDLKKALIMPALSLFIAILVFVGVTTFVLPQIGKSIPTKSMPIFMLILKNIGIIVPYIFVFVPIFILVAGYYYLFDTYVFWKYVMKIPIAGRLYSLSAYYNYFTVVTLLMQGGVSFDNAFDLAIEDTNAYIAKNMRETLDNIRSGESMRAAFQKSFSSDLPFYVFEMLDNAERSGDYGNNMNNVKDLLRDDFTDTKNSLIPMITIAAVGSVAVVVVIVALSVITPIQEVGKSIFDSATGAIK